MPKAAHSTIPRGVRTMYVPCMDEALLDEYNFTVRMLYRKMYWLLYILDMRFVLFLCTTAVSQFAINEYVMLCYKKIRRSRYCWPPYVLSLWTLRDVPHGKSHQLEWTSVIPAGMGNGLFSTVSVLPAPSSIRQTTSLSKQSGIPSRPGRQTSSNGWHQARQNSATDPHP